MNSNNVEIGSVIDRVSGQRLAVCEHFKRVSFSRSSSPDVYQLYNSCILDGGHCGCHGRKLKFKPCFTGVRVVWICPKLVGLPNPES